jgi:hypothetical protein
MTEQNILQNMKLGWSLANRGTGWWLTPPKSAKENQIQLSDVIVSELESKDLLITEELTWSAVAKLAS